jgi:hypothetical protein
MGEVEYIKNTQDVFFNSLIQKAGETDKGELVIYGIGSAEILDTQNEIVKMEALEKRLPQLLTRQTVSYKHRDTIVGKILPEFVINKDTLLRTKVDYPNEYDISFFKSMNVNLEPLKKYLFIVANIFNDNDFNKSLIQKIQEGIYNMFSISGHKINTSYICDKKNCYTSVDDLTLDAVTITEKGANPLAFFKPINNGGILLKEDIKEGETIAKIEAKVEPVIETPKWDILEKEIKEIKTKMGEWEKAREPKVEPELKKAEIKKVEPKVEPEVVKTPEGYKVRLTKEEAEEIASLVFEKLKKSETPVVEEEKKIPLAKVKEEPIIAKSSEEVIWDKLSKLNKIKGEY